MCRRGDDVGHVVKRQGGEHADCEGNDDEIVQAVLGQ